MNSRGNLWIVLLTSLSILIPSYGGEISGIVQNQEGIGVPGHPVLLIDSLGNHPTVISQSSGGFYFPNLTSGSYEVTLDHAPGFIIVSPICGIIATEIMLGESKNFIFEIMPAGVSVDFGRPAGGGLISPPPVFLNTARVNEDETFTFAMNIRQMETAQNIPHGFNLKGYFHIPSVNVSIIIEKVTLANAYSEINTQLDFSHEANAMLQVQFEVLSSPYLKPSGDVLLFSGRVISPNGRWLVENQNKLCLCVQNLTFYHNGEPSEDVELAKFDQPWGRCFKVATP